MNSIFEDTQEFLTKFEVKQNHIGEDLDHTILVKRIEHLKEELTELEVALSHDDKAEVIDALIDSIYIAAGTLNMLGASGQMHWDVVHKANMAKELSHNAQSHKLGISKPDGWVGPDHEILLEESYV